MSAATKILKDRLHPLVKTWKKCAERHSEPSRSSQEPSVLDALKRAMRRLTLDLLEDTATNRSDVFDDISTFMPWKRYGDKVRRGIKEYGMVFIHVETNTNGRPALLFVGTMLGKTLAFHLPDDGGRSPWDNFRRAFPQLAATLDHGQLIKITTTYNATVQLFGSDEVKYTQEIVDVGWIIDRLSIDEFPTMDGRTHAERERTRGLAMIWAVFGAHAGPVSESQWEQVHGTDAEFPDQREEHRLLAWTSSGWGEALKRPHSIYAQQLCRAGSLLAVRFAMTQARSDQLRSAATETAKAAVSAFPAAVQKPYDTTPDPPPKPEKRVRFADEVSSDDQQRPSTSGDRRDDDAEEEVVYTDPGSPFDDDNRGTESEVSVETSSVTEGTTHSEDDDEPEASGSDRSQNLGAKAHHRREGWGNFAFRLPKRARRQQGERSIPYPGGFNIRVETQRRSSINRARAEYRAANPERFNEAFLGSDCCHLCGETPKHSNVSECAVHYYRTRGKLPQQCTVPCLYCESPKHTTDACEFLHMKCTKCGFRGHMKFECDSRTKQEWLIAYLDCVHLGKLTRENPHGPLDGRWGFGPIARSDINEDLWELVKFKEKSMAKFRQRNQRGQPGFNPLKEAQLNWNLLLQRRERIACVERELRRERTLFEEERARWRAEMSQQRHEQRMRPLVHSMGCQTDWTERDREESPFKRFRR